MKKLLAVALLWAFSLSAGPVIPVEPAIAGHALMLGRSAVEKFQCRVNMADAAYVCPTRAQIPGLLAFAKKSRTTFRIAEAFDCDDAAREYRALAARYSVGQWPKLEAAIACGTAVAYVSGKVDGLCDYGEGGLHALIVVRRSDGQWLFVEPNADRAVPVEEAIYEGTISVVSLDF